MKILGGPEMKVTIGSKNIPVGYIELEKPKEQARLDF